MFLYTNFVLCIIDIIKDTSLKWNVDTSLKWNVAAFALVISQFFGCKVTDNL